MGAKNSSSKSRQEESVASKRTPGQSPYSSMDTEARDKPSASLVGFTHAPNMTENQKQLTVWCDQPPLWLLDAWTYDVVLQTCREKSLGASSGSNDGTVRVRQTAYGTTSMLLQREGAALAAICGIPNQLSSDNNEDHRDVALAVAMAKMIAFIPFAGVRATTESVITQSRILASDHAALNLVRGDRGSKFKTAFTDVWETSVELLELVTIARPGAGEDRMYPVSTACEACGAMGSIAFLHEVAKRGRVTDVAHYVDMYFRGACLSDNATSVDLLLRFPPPEWVEGIANFFHLSQGASEPLKTRNGSSSLIYLYSKLWRHLPSKNFLKNGTPILTEREFQKKIMECQVLFPEDPSRPQPQIQDTNYSALHSRLVSNILSKKQYPNCGRGGYMDFPNKDVSEIISLLSSRIPRGTLMTVDRKNYSQVDLAIMCVGLQPEYPGGWLSLTYSMGRTETVQISSLGPSRKTKVEIATHGLELYQKAKETDPDIDDSSAWNNLAYYMWVEDPDMLVTINGSMHGIGATFSCINCSQKGLNTCLRLQPFSSTGSKWDTVAGILKPIEGGGGSMAGASQRVSPETHFTPEGTMKHFTNIECQLVALALSPRRHIMWAHVGLILWKNTRSSSSSEERKEIDTPPTVGVPQKILNEVDPSIFDQALLPGGKKLSEMKRELQYEVVGAGGKETPTGECDHVVFFTELECYLAAYCLDDLGLLRELVREPPEDLQRFIAMVTPERISEKGRRIVESHMDGGGTFEKTYS